MNRFIKKKSKIWRHFLFHFSALFFLSYEGFPPKNCIISFLYGVIESIFEMLFTLKKINIDNLKKIMFKNRYLCMFSFLIVI